MSLAARHQDLKTRSIVLGGGNTIKNRPLVPPIKRKVEHPWFYYLQPRDARQRFRQGQLKMMKTNEFSHGYTQLNVAIIHRDFADDFAKFCELNSGPFPLVLKSAVGELSAGSFGKDSNVKTDLSGYRMLRDGKDHIVTEIKEDLSRFICFYLGCSFGFENIMKRHRIPVRNVEQKKQISMYRTNIPLIRSDRFGGLMVVSMRPVPADRLSLCCSLAESFAHFHGTPIHVGNPAKIGITSENLANPTYGDTVTMGEHDVPTFWCSGATAGDAIAEANMPLAFTNAQGCMFISDQKIHKPTDYSRDSVVVHCIDPFSQCYTLCSMAAYSKLMSIENQICSDPRDIGISSIRNPDHFISFCLAVSAAQSIFISTAFATDSGEGRVIENDGPTSTLTLVRMLISLNKKVTLAVDEFLVPIIQQMVDTWDNVDNVDNLVILSTDESYRILKIFDACIAIERTSSNADCNYYSIKTINYLPNLKQTESDERIFLKARSLILRFSEGGSEVGKP